MLIAVNRHLINKATRTELAEHNGSFENIDATAQEVADLVNLGVAFCAQHDGGWRKSSNFSASGFLAVDIDHGLTVEAALADPYVQTYASFLYTTPSHTATSNRFRIVFELEEPITSSDTMRGALTGMIGRFGADGACVDACRIFFGSSGSQPIMIGRKLPADQVSELVVRAEERAVKGDSKPDESGTNRSACRSKIDIPADKPIRVANGQWIALRDIPKGTRVYCSEHVDNRPSAFVLRNRRGNPGFYCSTCNATFFMDDGLGARDDQYEFDYLWRSILDVSYEEYSTHADHNGILNLSELRGGRIRQLNATFLPFDEVAPKSHSETDVGEVDGVVLDQPTDADCRVTLIKSPKGTGKTEWLQSLVKSQRAAGASVLLIGHRRALINATAKRLGLTSYLGQQDSSDEEPSHWTSATPDDGYAVCVDSLPNMDPKQHRYDVVLIDEVEQVFAHLLSGTLRNNRREALHMLRFYLNNAKAIYLLDADLSRVTVELLTEMFDDPAQSYQVLINQWQPECRTVHLYEGSKPDHLIGELVAALQRGERCFVCSNSKRLIDDLCKEIPNRVSRPLKHISITSENSHKSEVQDFIDNVKQRALEYDVIFASPSVGTGIDITFEDGAQHIDSVFGFFRERINTHFDIDQQLSRVRNPKRINLWISPLEFRFETDPEVIRAELDASQAEHRTLIGIDSDGTRRYATDSLYDTVFSTITAAQRASKNRLRHHFIQLRRSNGWNIEMVSRDDEASTLGRDIAKTAVNERRRAQDARILGAKELSAVAYESLRAAERAERVSEADKPALRRFEIESFYMQSVTQELLDWDNEGRMRNAIRNYETLTATDEDLRRSDHEARLKLAPDQPQGFQRKTLMRDLLMASGLLSSDEFDCTAEVSATSLQNFVTKFAAHKVQIERLFDISMRKDIRHKPVTQLKDVLRLVGLKLSQVRRDQSGGKSKVIYGLDCSSLEQIQRHVARRGDRAMRDAWDSFRIKREQPEVDHIDFDDPSDVVIKMTGVYDPLDEAA